MKLVEIEKTVYRKRLNNVIIGFIVSLAILSLVLGQALIMMFAEPAVSAMEGVEPKSNFRFNLLGVILALLACAAGLHQLREKPLFKEVYYVWQLKQVQNLIYRRLKKITAAAEQGDVNALIILNYYYTSLKQVYLLDDNTLTMSKLEKDISELNDRISVKNLSIISEQFDKKMLEPYK